MALASIGGLELQRGNIEAARPWVQRALDTAVEADDDYGVVGAQYTFGWYEILSGDTAAARTRFVAALDLVAESDALSVAQQIEGIAVAGMAANPRRAVTLFGAASRLREMVETPVQLPWSIWLEPAMAEARAALPEGIADKAWESGRAMSSARVLLLAREGAGGPRSGRASESAGGLSKRELEVARLVATGMTSRAIAERLFLSERTVESHLEHILTKLRFSSRTQVVGWVAEHLRDANGDA
jgi:DNA-binding CsgD family transcriptional regulator